MAILYGLEFQPGWNEKCGGCTKRLTEANESGYPCKAAYRTDVGVLLHPKINWDKDSSFGCDRYKQKFQISMKDVFIRTPIRPIKAIFSFPT